ncbi:MAG: porin family protein [Legionellales bacterium]|nr:porin family protein [Legionellales bacterium]
MRVYSFLLPWLRLLFLLFVGSVYAGEVKVEHPKTQFVASFSVGPGWYRAGHDQSVLLQPGFSNTYVANQQGHDLVTGELFLGALRQLHPRFWGQLGIAGALASPAHLSGIVWETGDPNLNNFTYAYHVNHAQVSLKGKLLSVVNQSWYPFISASLGAGFNASTHYTSTPLLFEIVQLAPFTKRTTTSFAYTVGVGVQKAISLHWQWGIEYAFSNWGKSQLGPIAGFDTTNTPGLNHLYVNQLMLNITFLT